MAKTEKTDKEAKETKEAKLKKAELVAETVPAENAPEAKIEVEKVGAKAGKRSAKAVKVAEEKQAKEVRKTQRIETAADAKKPAAKPPRRRVERAGKKYREAAKQIDKEKNYSLAEAVELALKSSPVKFDATLELHVNLAVDPKQADQNVRGTVVLPAGSGKTLKIAVLAEAEAAASAKKAGADIVGSDELLQQLDKEQIDFDLLIATPNLMAKLGKYAKLLGPKGLMPNPKSGTITNDVAKAIREAKAGKLEYRVDSSGLIHLGLGKVSFGSEKLLQNTEAVLASIRSAKPASLKGNYINSVYLTTSMGPSVRVLA